MSFRVWAPTRNEVDVVLDPLGVVPRCERLQRSDDGTFAATFDTVRPRDLYMYLLDGDGPYPDPCSRFQPQGVHGPSAVVDPSEFGWSDYGWRGVPLERAVIYELHVGTFTAAGTFAGVAERLPYLAALGVTAIELMPVADASGTWLVVAPRLVVPLVTEERPLPIGPEVWATTQVLLPPVTRAARYRHVITGECCETTSDRSSLPMASALGTCPVALLWAPAREQGVRADAA